MQEGGLVWTSDKLGDDMSLALFAICTYIACDFAHHHLNIRS
jgi:hypothetical protein